jgi:hypothetical protein
MERENQNLGLDQTHPEPHAEIPEQIVNIVIMYPAQRDIPSFPSSSVLPGATLATMLFLMADISSCKTHLSYLLKSISQPVGWLFT